MNYGEYMRKKERSLTKVIGLQRGQDASQVTLKNQILNTTYTTTSFISTYTGYTGNGFVGVPLTIGTSDANSCKRVSNGLKNADARQNLIGYAQMATVSQNQTPNVTILPCMNELSTIKNAPSSQPCLLSPGIIFSDPTELIADQGRQASLRTQYKLPNKLQGLRGPVVNNR
jgi:hypothetical protein